MTGLFLAVTGLFLDMTSLRVAVTGLFVAVTGLFVAVTGLCVAVTGLLMAVTGLSERRAVVTLQRVARGHRARRVNPPPETVNRLLLCDARIQRQKL